MKIKKYIAKNLKEGKEQIIQELGDDAVVLSTRTSTDPDTGNAFVEIVAAVDDDKNNKEKSRPARNKLAEVNLNDKKNSSSDPSYEFYPKVLEEFDAIKSQLNDLADFVKYKYSGSLSSTYSSLYKKLRKIELDDETALNIVGKISSDFSSANDNQIISEARRIILQGMSFSLALQKPKSRQIAFFIGPTGTGKTTNLVKIAVVNKLVHQSEILLVSADTYKVGGSEQLKTFASITGMAFKEAYNPDDLKKIIEKETEYDYIFIDTTGRSQSNTKHILELKKMIQSIEHDHIFLVLSSTVSKATLDDILDVFSTFNPSSLIITKLDESRALGSFVSSLKKNKIPVMYLSTGQQIPDDLEPAGKVNFGKIVLPDNI